MEFLREQELLNADLEVFLDQYGTPYATIVDGEIRKTLPLDSREFKLRYINKIHTEFGVFYDTKKYSTAVDYLVMLAYKSSKTLHHRIAQRKDRIYYDLDERKTVVIDKEGCKLIKTPKNLFKRSLSWKPQVIPELDADPQELPKYISRHFNLQSEEEVVLLTLYIMVCLMGGDFPIPLLHIEGEHGAGKSGVAKRIVSIIDTQTTRLSSFPTNADDLSLRLTNSLVTSFDNVSYIRAELSDILCQGVTGGVRSKRKLFTETDETYVDIRSVVIINSTENVIRKSDLLERTLHLSLRKLTEKELRTEKEVMKKFQNDLPQILGCCFNLLSDVLRNNIEIESKISIRMADFQQNAIKFGKELGYKESDIVKLLMENQRNRSRQAIDDNVVGQCINYLMEKQNEYVGSVSDLLGEVKNIALSNNIAISSIPSQPNVLSRRLNEIKSDLERTCGIYYNIINTGAFREISVKKGKG